VKFEEKPQVQEYETDDDEDDSESERAPIELGEDVELTDDEEDDGDSVNTEEDILQRAEKSGTVALDL
jgi:hypothetical protein